VTSNVATTPAATLPDYSNVTAANSLYPYLVQASPMDTDAIQQNCQAGINYGNLMIAKNDAFAAMSAQKWQQSGGTINWDVLDQGTIADLGILGITKT
jgi:hypothetical protein